MKKKNDINDRFSDALRKAVGDFEMPVSDNVWNRIETSLDLAPKKIPLWSRLPRLLRAASIVAAAAAVISFFIIPYYIYNETSVDVPLVEIRKKTTPLTVEQTTVTLSESGIRQDDLAQTPRSIATVLSKLYTAPETDETPATVAAAETAPEATHSVHFERENRNTLINNNSNKREQKIASGTVSSYNPLFADNDLPLPKKKIRKTNGLRISLGSGTADEAITRSDVIRSDASSNIFDTPPMRSATRTVENMISFDDYPETSYRAPLSFGLSVSRDLTNRLTVESGLIYTYLRTDFTDRQLSRNAKLELHYIGLPLNVQYRIVGDRTDRFSIYLSAGGTIEKGLYSRYTKTTAGGGRDRIGTHIDGLQFSISAAPGLEYRLARQTGLFVEPRFGYYFKNDQPTSVRTQHPLAFGINAGLRYIW